MKAVVLLASVTLADQLFLQAWPSLVTADATIAFCSVEHECPQSAPYFLCADVESVFCDLFDLKRLPASVELKDGFV